MRNLPFQLGALPINWVGEDVKEHGADTTYEQIMEDMKRLGLRGTEMGRKDIRWAVLEEADFITCIRKGVFTVPGTGDLVFKPIIEELVARGYSGWAMLEGEQDPAKYPAFEFASKALAYLESICPTKAG
jgi:sugar phosphate isomerase/epimerase